MTEASEAGGWPVLGFETDAAAMAVFDPAVLAGRSREASSWWRDEESLDLDEVWSGQAVIAPMGREGEYRAQLIAGELPEALSEYERGRVRGLGVEVRSGELYLGPAERLPGDGQGERIPALPNRGRCFEVAPGRYGVILVVLDWRFDARFFGREGQVAADAPPDVAVLLSPWVEGQEPPEALPPLMSLRRRAKVEVAPASSKLLTARARSGGGAAVAPSRGARSRSSEDVPLTTPQVARLADGLAALGELNAQEPWVEYAGGELELKPSRPDLKASSWPVDEVFRKVRRVREQLRVLEQKVNGSELEAYEKAELQGAITEVYRALVSLTAR